MSDELTIWDYVNMITSSKEVPEFDEHFDKTYVPFVVNRFFSFLGESSTVIVNEINESPGLGKREHFIFLHSIIKKSKRRAKWEKQPKNDKVKLLAEVYECSYEKAKTFADLISEEQMAQLEEHLYTGGVQSIKKGKQKGAS